MKSKGLNFLFASVLVLLLVVSLSLVSLYFVNQTDISEFINQHLNKDFNIIYKFKTHFQLRCLLSGCFVFFLFSILLLFRKKIIGQIPEIKESLHNLIVACKQSFKRQFLLHNRKYTFFFFGILIVSIISRLYYLNSPIRYDEGFTYFYFTKKPWFLVFSYYDCPNNHIFHTILVKFLIGVFGDSIVTLRLTAFVFGVALLPITYVYVGKFFNKNAAILATSFVSISSILVSYSVNARGYTIIYCAFILLLIVVEIIKKHNNKLGWILFVLIQVIGVYTIPVMLYMSFILYIYLILSIRTKKDEEKKKIPLSRIVLSGLIVLYFSMLVYLPVYLLMGSEAILSNETVKSLSYSLILENLGRNLKLTADFLFWDFHLLIICILIIGIGSSFIFIKQCRYLIFSVFCFLIGAFFIQRVNVPQNCLAILFPLFYILSSIGIIYIAETYVKIKGYYFSFGLSLVILIVMAMTLIRTNSPTKKFDVVAIRDPKSVFSYLITRITNNDRVLCRYPVESSVCSYFYFNNIPNSILQNNVFNSEKVFVIRGNRFNQTEDFILEKNEIDRADFHKSFSFVSQKDFDSTVSIFEYRRK